MSKPKIVVITCYKDPNYIRGRVLLRSLVSANTFEVVSVQNTHASLLMRIPEVMIKLFKARFSDKPDIYLLTFRGYELLWYTLLIAWGKPVVFDEFIQPVEVVTEHRAMKGNTFVSRLMRYMLLFAPLYYVILKKCAFILTDTDTHADYSANISKIDRSKYYAIPVGADEEVFKPSRILKRNAKDPFSVFYYGNMVPLHGIQYVIEAALKLKRYSFIEFTIVGGDKSVAEAIRIAKDEGANISYHAWVPFDEIPNYIKRSNICLGGPFGDTVQSHNVVTGKTYQFIASGRPVILGKSKATNADFSDKRNALLVPQANATALAKSIAWAATHPHELNQITKNGFLLYKANFSEKVIAKDLGQLLGSLVVGTAEIREN